MGTFIVVAPQSGPRPPFRLRCPIFPFVPRYCFVLQLVAAFVHRGVFRAYYLLCV